MPIMCPANRVLLTWIDEHYAEASAWLALHDRRSLGDLSPWEQCDLAYAMLAARNDLRRKRHMSRVAGKSPANGAAATAAQAEKAARRAQARAEGARTGEFIDWKGERFRIEPGEPPGAAQMILTHFAAADPKVRDPQAEDGMWHLLEMLLAQPSGIPPGQDGFDVEKWEPGEFNRFMRYAMKTRATLEEIVEAMQELVSIVSARPTAPPPGSSAGRPATTPSSTGTSSGPAEQDSSG